MIALWATGFVVLVLLVEAIWLFSRRPSLAVLALLGPAAMLLGAVIAALLGANGWWVVGFLTLSGPLHLLDLRLRGLL